MKKTSCGPIEPDLISAVRVRVGGIDTLTPAAQAKIELVAQAIAEQTGLHVDIMVGSSPQPVLVHLPGFGDVPARGYIEELWIKKGVNTLVSVDLNRADRLLFGTMLFVCLLFLFNANLISNLGRLPEFGVMKALGWRQSTLFRLLCGKSLLLGLASGFLAALAAAAIVRVFSLSVSLNRIALLVPLGAGAFLLGRAASGRLGSLGLAHPGYPGRRDKPKGKLQPDHRRQFIRLRCRWLAAPASETAHHL